MQSELIQLLFIGGALALGAISPGQSFILVAKTAITTSRRQALATALGMGVGCALFAVIALLGLHSALLTVPWLYKLLKIVGGLYLIWLAIAMLRSARKGLVLNVAQPAVANIKKGFAYGLLTQLCNPNTALVLGSIFAALLSHPISGYLYLLLPAMAFAIDTLWYAFVACALSSARPRTAYLRYKSAIDRISGGVMALLGIKLIFSR